MFNYISKCFSRITKRESREIKLLMLGVDNAGKSTIINDLKGEAKEPTIPTIGFSSAEFKLLNFKVTAYDVGGGPRIRGIWKDYYAEIYGVVYVIDASDRERIADSRTVLREAFSDSRLAGKPFVVFANKQDIDGALSEEDIELQFELEQLAMKCGSRYKVFQCTALLNGGRKVDSQLKKGLSWLLQTMNEDFPTLQERVLKEMEIQKEADKKERAERMERVRKNREERFVGHISFIIRFIMYVCSTSE
ncbi:ADP-ribosylation factor 13B isoform X2 [Paramuricea clavata]|uniref:ADP-ribosylation factor 13B isoform X2 n=1 Tax=Paramuricea clavata TaxID=317549 RepID=A0A6S7FMC2_PARCT|nr:ADP-ribosylation factor 13B isoform X2 [Paramuricea clavata]